ncbi:hypothetical protein AW14_14660 [Siansivirga zeaxanthinifaciens CC-SAMT-1]|uniref:Uncharacterized protein n=1 Tax=Siansivirga zeaxanthinifaciens CC-SAMT-1 TaxID=1454006 RepID=A0A0C5W103_9FLAO|nr:hypothetical protein AW14_14660 [Siansivirga zeaxanthinifaciens CC-SAMT-1]
MILLSLITSKFCFEALTKNLASSLKVFTISFFDVNSSELFKTKWQEIKPKILILIKVAAYIFIFIFLEKKSFQF